MLSECAGKPPGFLDYVNDCLDEVASDVVLAVLMAEYRRVKLEADAGIISIEQYASACVDIVMTVKSRAAGRKLLQNYLNNY